MVDKADVRSDNTPDPERYYSDWERKPPPAPDDAAGLALARARAMAANRGYVPEGFDRSVALAEREDRSDDSRHYTPTGDAEWTDPDT